MTREEAIKLLCVEKSIIIEVDGNKGAEKMLQAYDMAIEALSAEAAIGDYPNDLISRSALMEYCSNQKSKSIDNNDIARFPSAEARPTVIRSRTLLPTKDFMEWAKRIREINPNAVVIPCDAEAPSAEARPTGEWIFNPTDAIDLMFAKPKCSKCGFESSDGGNFCPNCGAIMTPYKGGESDD